MRTIKFRAKRIDNGEWVEGHYFQSRKDIHCIEQDFLAHTIDESTLGQFIDNMDKNGVYIWEDDILEVERFDGFHDKKVRGKVAMVKDQWLLKLANGKLWDNGHSYEDFSLDVPWENSEVIGNVTDNKELLS